MALELPAFDPFKELQEHDSCQISFIRRIGKAIRLPCFVNVLAKPFLEIDFFPEQMHLDEIDLDCGCRLQFKNQHPFMGQITAVEQAERQSKIRRGAVGPITAAQRRKYFRVEAKVLVSARHFSEEDASDNDEAMVSGESINLSASGLLASFPAPLLKHDWIRLQLRLPMLREEVVDCIGRVIRTDQTGDGYQVAFNFDWITHQSQETIMKYCLAQRVTNLRLRIRLLDLP